MKKSSGEFGKLVKNYKTTRPGYPSKVIKDIYTLITSESPKILDLGCGTGISTRQLARKGSVVIGCDVDTDMLANASPGKHKNIEYVRGDAEKLPFKDQTFDAITMFTSFHWFTTKKAINEIKRVLKPSGIICIVQPRYKSPFRRDMRKIINQTLKLGIQPKYGKRDFLEFLSEYKFIVTRKKTYKTVNKYSLGQFLKLLQSISTWSYVPALKRKGVLKILRGHYKGFLKNNVIHDPVDIQLICAKRLK
ncbi:MAG: class I SAM-dependent methyltransferase [bacterium]|nr:class I SAM-dependent methyltransferase [bacterium]